VRQALNFRPNPLLPDTRSEACLPLALGERVVGVLDLQSAEVGFFNDNNLPVFQVIAAQLAIAAQNVALLVEAQQARAALETQTRHLARRGWAGFLNAIALPDRLSAQYNAAEHAPPAGDTLTLEFPLTMLGEAIGEIRLEGLAAGSWAAEDQELLQTVAQQVAQQAENLRIVAEAERYRAEAEAASRRLTREAWTAYAKHTLSFAYQNDSVQPLDDLALPEARTALDVTARGEPIGQIILPRATFDAAEAEIATAVTEQLGAHLENLRLIEQTRQRAAQLETLNRLSQTIATQLDLQGLLQLAGESIRDLFQADYTFVALYDSDHNQLTFPYFRGPQGLMDLSPVAVGPGLISYVVNHRQPLLIARNSEQAMRQYGAVLVGSGEHAKTWLGVPVLAGQDVLGVVSVQVMAREEAYDDNDVRLLATIAATLATALQNIRLFDRMRLTSALNERLYQLASRIAAADDLQAVLAALAETFPVPAVNRLVLFIFEYDAQGQISAARIGANWHSGAGALPTPVGTRYPPAVFSAIKSLFGRAPLIVADPAHDARVDLATRGVLQRQNIASLGALPLIVGQRQMGALLLETQTPYDFPDVDLQPYLAVAGTVAVALDNQLLLAEAQTRLRREQILRAVTEQVRGAPDVDAVLRRTAQEVGQALGRRVFVQIKEIAPVAVSSVVTVKG
jgi:GAF domain-containing protein